MRGKKCDAFSFFFFLAAVGVTQRLHAHKQFTRLSIPLPRCRVVACLLFTDNFMATCRRRQRRQKIVIINKKSAEKKHTHRHIQTQRGEKLLLKFCCLAFCAFLFSLFVLFFLPVRTCVKNKQTLLLPLPLPLLGNAGGVAEKRRSVYLMKCHTQSAPTRTWP